MCTYYRHRLSIHNLFSIVIVMPTTHCKSHLHNTYCISVWYTANNHQVITGCVQLIIWCRCRCRHFYFYCAMILILLKLDDVSLCWVMNGTWFNICHPYLCVIRLAIYILLYLPLTPLLLIIMCHTTWKECRTIQAIWWNKAVYSFSQRWVVCK